MEQWAGRWWRRKRTSEKFSTMYFRSFFTSLPLFSNVKISTSVIPKLKNFIFYTWILFHLFQFILYFFVVVLEKPLHVLFHTCAFNGKLNELKGKLFRAAQLSRKRNVATEDVIEEVIFLQILSTKAEIKL